MAINISEFWKLFDSPTYLFW